MTSTTAPFTHDAMLYGTDAEFVSAVVPFIRDGLAEGHSVSTAVTASNTALLRDALGTDAREVAFLGREEFYTRPAGAIAGAQRLLTDAAGKGFSCTRVIGEVAFGSDRRDPSWARYESALNRVFAQMPTWFLCAYDSRVLAPEVLADARRTHPTELTGRARTASAGYLPTEQFLQGAPQPMPLVTGAPAIAIDIDEVSAARRALRAVLVDRGWAGFHRFDDLVLAASEVVANSIRHGAGRRRLRVWVSDRTATCEVSDEGSGLRDPLAGFRPPGRHQSGGRGLWIVAQLCDALAIERRGAATVVRFSVTATA